MTIEKKYLTTSDNNHFTKEKDLVNKYDVSNLVKNSDLNKKLLILATKAELKPEEDKPIKLQTLI